jgi:hypothetical protein
MGQYKRYMIDKMESSDRMISAFNRGSCGIPTFTDETEVKRRIAAQQQNRKDVEAVAKKKASE